MQRSLYEMDMENARNEAVKEGHERGLQQGLQEEGLEQGMQQGSDNERLALVTDLIKSGQSKEQVI